MNRVTPLVRTGAVRLERFDHAPGDAHHDPDRERATGHAVSIVERGAFAMRLTGAWRRVTAGHVVVTRPGLEFSCAHDDEHPCDCCLTVAYSEQAIESLLGVGVRLSDDPIQPATNRRAYLAHALGSCAPGEEARAEALAGELQWSLSGATPAARLFPAARLAWYARRVDHAKALIGARFAEPLALSTIAREVGMSVFHFARVFAELEGTPPHRYLTEVRLAHACAQLRDGAPVTQTCFAVGFGSLSHFVTTFRRRYGVRPSEAHRAPPSAPRWGRAVTRAR